MCAHMYMREREREREIVIVIVFATVVCLPHYFLACLIHNS